MSFTTLSSSAFPADILTVELYFNGGNMGAAEGPHLFAFLGENYETCTTCSIIYENCTDATSCDRAFLATEGLLDITASSKLDGESFTGTITNARYVEVTIDPTTLESTEVPDGDVWCIDMVAFDSTVAASP